MRADDRGIATPAVVALAGALLVVAVLAASLGRLLVDHRRVAAAADLAALAGAVAVQYGRPPCPEADRVADANGADLMSCRQVGDDVEVVARRAWPVPGGRLVPVTARARAGPEPAPGP